ncbi:CBS domain containing-hemolysin-like protein [Desulfitobacterium sp. LBE]|nr:CBS domain containing-hemolysin-like protein [Desulfitobacterium sp. LBE]
MWSIAKVVAALFLVALNAFFVAAEFSLVKVRKTRLAELSESGSRKATLALAVTSQLDAYLSACQLGITLASLGLGWLGEPAIATLLAPLFKNLVAWDGVLTHTVSVVIAFLLITFLHIVLGELVPKSIAIQRAESAALWTAGPLKMFYKLFYPVIRFLNGLANLILKLGGISPANESDLAHTEEELRMLVDASQRHGILDKMEGKLLDNVFEFSDRVVSEVMVPRQDMMCLYIQDSMEEVLETVKTSGHTRYPLCDDDKDNVIGLVHMRDLLSLSESSVKNIGELKRDILIVPEGMPISHLVQKMRVQRTHLAVVVDEFGGTAGMVTIEDLIEELVGEIYDEFESAEQAEIIKSGESEYLINGRVLLDDLSELLAVEFEDETVSTIGGFVFNRLGRKPVKGDRIDFMDYTFTVMEVVGFRITRVKASRRPAPDSADMSPDTREDSGK